MLFFRWIRFGKLARSFARDLCMIYKHDKKLRPDSGIVENAKPHFITDYV